MPGLAAQLSSADASDVAVGVVLLACGALAWSRRRPGRVGALIALGGGAWLAGDLFGGLVYVHRGPLAHLLLSYPSGRPRSRAVGIVVVAAYADGVVPALARSEWLTVALMAAILVAAGWRHRVVAGVERRARAVALAGALAVAGALGAAAIGRLVHAGVESEALWAYYIAVVVTALGLTAELLWGGWTSAAVTGLVVDLGDHHEPQALRAALARMLGDPDLQVAYRVAGVDAWVDETGRPVGVPARDMDSRTVTMVREQGEPVAALVHDKAALADKELAAAVAAAARLAVANARMQAKVGGRVLEVDASRRRLVEAGDDERRRLGDELRAGAERRLAAVSARLEALATGRDGAAGAELQRLSGELHDARESLRDFAQGIHPRALTQHGLGAALAELAERSGARLTLPPGPRRFPPALEAAVFFVCSEALANVAKHAGAADVEVSIAAAGEQLLVSVADDGAGGADPARGTGLRGLADRVEALGGTLCVDSPAGGGTRLEARLPITTDDRH